MNYSVLFVDDEQSLLDSFRRSFRDLRDLVDFHFCTGGIEALALLQTTHVDVVFSDMRMPIMNGDELLIQIREKHPAIIRVMLTGQADQASILRTVQVVHQFLTKPVLPETLRAVVLQTCQLSRVLQAAALKEFVSRLSTVPSLPDVYSKLQQKLTDPECSFADLAAVIAEDVAMSAKLLHLVNSAFFGLYRHVESISKAVSFLGIETLSALVLQIGVFSTLESTQAQFIGQLQQHSIQTAAIAKYLATMERSPQSVIDEAFIAGLLHDIGKLIFLQYREQSSTMPNALDTDDWMEYTWEEEEEEEAYFGENHGTVGGYLLSLWGIRFPIIEAVAYHHAGAPVEVTQPTLKLIIAADQISRLLQSEMTDCTEIPEAVLQTLQTRQISIEQFRLWLSAAQKVFCAGA